TPVCLGPRRALIADLAGATRAAGMRFGVYYSGGLDWHVTDLAPLDSHTAVRERRAGEPRARCYAQPHRPPGLSPLSRHYSPPPPHGVVNDRWGATHRDYRTSEYQIGRENETAAA